MEENGIVGFGPAPVGSRRQRGPRRASGRNRRSGLPAVADIGARRGDDHVSLPSPPAGRCIASLWAGCCRAYPDGQAMAGSLRKTSPPLGIGHRDAPALAPRPLLGWRPKRRASKRWLLAGANKRTEPRRLVYIFEIVVDKSLDSVELLPYGS
jgi:hypothetical protein